MSTRVDLINPDCVAVIHPENAKNYGLKWDEVG